MLGREDAAVNPFLLDLLGLLGPLYASGKAAEAATAAATTTASPSAASGLDAFCTYLYGVVLRGLGRRAEAQEALLASVHAYPLNWSAWLDLCGLVADDATGSVAGAAGAAAGAAAAITSLPLPRHWAADVFTAHALVEVQANAAALKLYRAVSVVFPGSSYLQAQVARALYNLRQFDGAQAVFHGLRRVDPHRLEDIDTLSNILYVKGDRPGLAEVAHKAFLLDRSRPDTCCAIGNYYSLRGEHEKAVLYFRRALRLCPSYSAAWTLMGHEHLELRNTPAAIESYRRAAELNPRDYRAWYGLGQTYELLQMYVYAAYYFKRAAALRPHDARMWCALGQIYENLRRLPQAIACYERATRAPEGDRLALLRLARLHSAVNGGGAPAATPASMSYYARYLEDIEAGLGQPGGRPSGGAAAGTDAPPAWAADPTVAEALLALAGAALAASDNDAAEAYAGKVLEMSLPSERAQAGQIMASAAAARRERAAAAATAAAGGARAPLFAPRLPVPDDPMGLSGPHGGLDAMEPAAAAGHGVAFPAPVVSFGALSGGGQPVAFGDVGGVARPRPGTFAAAAAAAGGGAAAASPAFRFPAGSLFGAALAAGHASAATPAAAAAAAPLPPQRAGGVGRGVPSSAGAVTPTGVVIGGGGGPGTTTAVTGGAGVGGGGGGLPLPAAGPFQVTPVGDGGGGVAADDGASPPPLPGAGATRRRTKSALNGSEDLRDLTTFGLPQDLSSGGGGGAASSAEGLDAVGDIFPSDSHRMLLGAVDDGDDLGDDDDLGGSFSFLAGASVRSPLGEGGLPDDDDDDGPRLTTRFGGTTLPGPGLAGRGTSHVSAGGARRVSAGGGSAAASFLFEGLGAGDLSAIPDGSPAHPLIATARFSTGMGPASTLRSRGGGGGSARRGGLFTPQAGAEGGGASGGLLLGAEELTPIAARVSDASGLEGGGSHLLMTMMASSSSSATSGVGGAEGGRSTIRGRGLHHLPDGLGGDGSGGGGGQDDVDMDTDT